MLDYQLFQLIKPAVDAALNANAIVTQDGLGMTKSYSPTPQGVMTDIQVFCQKLPSDQRYGWTGRKDVWNADTGSFDHAETQIYVSAFQMGATVLMDPKTPSQLSASDILQIVSAALSNQKTIETFNANDVGILRITDIRIMWFKNDRDNYQMSPSFDFYLTHKNVTVTTNPKAYPVVNTGTYPV